MAYFIYNTYTLAAFKFITMHDIFNCNTHMNELQQILIYCLGICLGEKFDALIFAPFELFFL